MALFKPDGRFEDVKKNFYSIQYFLSKDFHLEYIKMQKRNEFSQRFLPRLRLTHIRPYEKP